VCVDRGRHWDDFESRDAQIAENGVEISARLEIVPVRKSAPNRHLSQSAQRNG
jgi:hypothetical protein